MSIRVMYFGLLTLSLGYLASELGMVSLDAGLLLSAFRGLFHRHFADPLPHPLSHGRPWRALAVAVLFAALCGLLVIRVRGIYFLMLTLVLGNWSGPWPASGPP